MKKYYYEGPPLNFEKGPGSRVGTRGPGPTFTPCLNGPNQWFCCHEKSSKSLKQNLSKKKILLAYFCRHNLQHGVRKLFLNKWVARCLRFGDFKVT